MEVKGSYIVENGESINKKFNVLINQLENEEYEATFIDKDTSEIIKHNSIEAKSSAWPLIILAAVARYGVKYAVKNMERAQLKTLLKLKALVKFYLQ